MRTSASVINSAVDLSVGSDVAIAGKATVIVGTEGDDGLQNESGGPAKMLGLGGNDTLLGDDWNDTLLGGDGNDVLLGYGGDDKLVGGAGDDFMRGYEGSDTFDGGAGYDIASIYAYGAASPAHVDLSSFVIGQTFTLDDGLGGTDTLIGIERISFTATAGDDVLIGSAASDGFTTAGGNDSVDAGSGDDYIADYGGDSTLQGGDGDDTIAVYDHNYFSGHYFVGGHDIIDAGDGFDSVAIDWALSAGNATVKWGAHVVKAELADGSASETIYGLEALTFYGGSGGATIRGGDFNDQLFGGSNGVDVISGRGGADLITGGALADSLTGGGGDDTILGMGGNDTLAGGSGLDRLEVLFGVYDSEHGVTVYDYSAFDISGGTHQIDDRQGGVDTISGFEAVEVYTSGGRDSVLGSAGADIIHDSHGTDVLRGGAGDDLILQTQDYIDLYSDLNDTLDGGAGTDTLSFEKAFQTGVGWTFDLAAGTVTAFLTGTDTISGFEHVIGSGGADTMLGSMVGETLEGGAGADVIQGRAGADVLIGGAGGDSFVYEALTDSAGRALDLITDLDASDAIDLSGIDADVIAEGDQAFHLVSAFSHHAGELVLSYDGAHKVTHLTADVDGDGHADFAINLSGDQHQFDGFVL